MRRSAGLGVLLTALLLVACGQGGSDGGGSAPDPSPPPATTPSEPPPAAMDPPEPEPAPEPATPPAPEAPSPDAAVTDDGTTVTVALTGNDALQYNLDEIRVPAGRRIRLTLTHVGQGPKESMGHNFVLLAPGTDMTTFGLAAATAAATGYIPEDQRDKILANTDVVGGGESTTIEFDAPAPGTYDYLCSFVGHFSVMNGKLIVE
ncbi:MAG: plastocyanin/azurin family copper-binding protein [Myxococcota bacterium]